MGEFIVEFLEWVKKFKLVKYSSLKDFADKFNSQFCSFYLLLCALMIFFLQYFLRSITCYIANDPGGNAILKYVENYCWIEGTIPRNYSGRIPDTEEEWEELRKIRLTYYQWIPFFITIQCVCFYVPWEIWSYFCYNTAGSDLKNIIKMADRAGKTTKKADHDELLTRTIEDLDLLLQWHQPVKIENCCSRVKDRLFKILGFLFLSKRRGNWMFKVYLLIKFLCIGNCLAQLTMMKNFLRLDCRSDIGNCFFAIKLIRGMILQQDWQETQIFPRVAFCYVPLKMMGNLNKVVAQCTLPVNMFAEKVFVFIWFLIVISGTLELGSLPIWVYRMIPASSRRSLINKFLQIYFQTAYYERVGSQITADKKKVLEKFVFHYLRDDGVFMLRMMEMNAGDIVTIKVVGRLWERYLSILDESGDLEKRSIQLSPTAPTSPTHKEIEEVKLMKAEQFV